VALARHSNLLQNQEQGGLKKDKEKSCGYFTLLEG